MLNALFVNLYVSGKYVTSSYLRNGYGSFTLSIFVLLIVIGVLTTFATTEDGLVHFALGSVIVGIVAFFLSDTVSPFVFVHSLSSPSNLQ